MANEPGWSDMSNEPIDGGKPVVLKVRGGCGRYVTRDGKPGTSGRGPLWEEDVTFTVASTQDQTLFALEGDMEPRYVVRRLTPVECERLQGMPDGHTDLTGCDVDAVTDAVAASLGYDAAQREALRRKVRKWSGGCPDGKRYKAIGNSMAVPCMRWIAERLEMMDGIIGDAVYEA